MFARVVQDQEYGLGIIDKNTHKEKNSQPGFDPRVFRVIAEYPDQLKVLGSIPISGIFAIPFAHCFQSPDIFSAASSVSSSMVVASTFLHLQSYSLSQASLIPTISTSTIGFISRFSLSRLESRPSPTRKDLAEVLGCFAFANKAFPGSLSLTTRQLGVVDERALHHAQSIPDTTIFRAEAQGCDLALDVTRARSFTLVVILITDNKTFFGAVKKGRSNDFVTNNLIRRFLGRMRGERIFIKWVKSADNLADLPSRIDCCPSLPTSASISSSGSVVH